MSVQHLLTPEAKAKASAARKRARVPRGYVAQGRRGERVSHVHRLRAEAALGKPLPPAAEVHHVDGDKANPTARLVICQDTAYHFLLHFRARIIAAGGNPNTERICSRCKAVKPIGEFNRNKMRKADGLDNFCRHCVREKNAIQKMRRKALGIVARPRVPRRLTPEQRADILRQPFRQTHCKRGHELTGANLRVEASGSRRCRACENERCQRRNATGYVPPCRRTA